MRKRSHYTVPLTISKNSPAAKSIRPSWIGSHSSTSVQLCCKSWDTHASKRNSLNISFTKGQNKEICFQAQKMFKPINFPPNKSFTAP